MKAFLLSGLVALSLAAPLCRADEPFRPQFHFTPERNWMNDPNGLLYYAGEYHLFFQYNMTSIGDGNKSWGHAVSRDLVHWDEIAVAIPAANGVSIWSGSAVVDWNNTSGFGTGTEPPMVAIYTGFHDGVQDQRIACSNDRGRTWINYSGNPVIPTFGDPDFRDPKVMWHEDLKKWVMTVALSSQRKVRFYTSPDLKNWTLLSEFGPAGVAGGVWECPDLFPITVEGEATRKWILTTSIGGGSPNDSWGVQYFVGDFDGTRFIDDESLVPPQTLPSGTLISDFEGTAFPSGWTRTGTAFGNAPESGPVSGQYYITGFRGSRFANSFHGGDGTTGRLTSPAFTLDHGRLSFLIGGGNHPGQTCMNLVVNNQIVRTATGRNSEHLEWTTWDVSEYAGQQARLEIIDNATGSWGHVLIDHILLSDTPVPPEPDKARWLDYGPDYYASVTWSDIAPADGRRLSLAWMVSNAYLGSVPTTPWRGGMTVPRQLLLRHTPLGLRLAQQPVAELDSLHTSQISHASGTLEELNSWLATQATPRLFDSTFELEVPSGGNASLRIGSDAEHTTLTWDRSSSTIAIDRTASGVTSFSSSFPGIFTAPVPIDDTHLKLHLLLDTASLEVFGADGLTSLSTLIFPNTTDRSLKFSGTTGAKVTSFSLSGMNSARSAKPSGLLAQWKFDEDAPGPYADATGNGPAMSLANRVSPASANGIQGKGMEIRRDDVNPSVSSLLVPSSEKLTPSSFTVSFFLNPKANDNSKLSLLRWESPAGLAWGFEILANRVMNFYVFDSDSSNDVQSVAQLPFEAFDSSDGSSDNIDNDSAWHHVAASYDSTTGNLTLYLDGVKSGKTATGLQGAPHYGTSGIGGGIQTGNALAIYDDFRIYSGVLPDSDIEYLRSHPGEQLPTPPPGEPAKPSAQIDRHGSSTFVTWSDATGLALWQSSDLNHWTKVPGSESLTTYATVTDTVPQIFFRLAPP